MSFVRVRKSNSAGLPRKQKTHKKKPAWDDTIQDLTTLKATPEEIEQRKAAHRSKNALAARLEKISKEKAKKQDLSISNAEARQLAVMKEVLYDQQQLHDVLSKSDRMMAVVNDLFGDDPRRFTGFPNVTSAPTAENNGRSRTIVANLPDVKTRMETLSESMMDQSALNDLQETDSESEEEMEPIMYQPKIDLNRFQRFLEAEEKNNTLSTISGQAHLSHMDQGPIQSTRIQDTQSLLTTRDEACTTPPKKHNESIEMLRSPKSAMNDTQKIKKTKRRVEPDTTQHNSTFNLNELKKVLVQLENEIGDLETQTGRRPRAEQPRQESFSGYTMSLVDSVTKLSRYLKDCEIRLKTEALLREQLTQDVKQLTSLIDALTSDIIQTQEEYNTLKSEYRKYREETGQEIRALKVSLMNAGLYIPIEPEPQQMDTTPPRGRMPAQSSLAQDMAVQNNSQNSQQPMAAIPQHLNPTDMANPSAVLLSPPVRKTRIQQPKQDTGPLPMMDFGQQLEEPAQSEQLPYHGRSLQQQGHLDISDLEHPEASHGPVPTRSKVIQEVKVSSGREDQKHPVQSNVNIPQDPRGSVTQGVTLQESKTTGNQPAHVNVPRPTPLVQSTVQPQQNGQVDLTLQIAQLNKQHEEAQKRLQALLEQQQSQQKQREMAPQHGQYKLAVSSSSQPPSLAMGKGAATSGGTTLLQQDPNQYPQQLILNGGNLPKTEYKQQPSEQRGLPAYPVSPPISPISQRSDNFTIIQGMNQNVRVNTAPPYGITVSLPTVDLSLDSSPSPR